MALIFLVGFRVGLNITNSNVIDVGYSGVIGADRLTHGEGIYGNFPDDNESGDTYGPVNYYAYVPFELAFPVVRASGTTCRLRTPRRSSSTWRRCSACFWSGGGCGPGARGRDLGIVLAYAWASYPYTLFVLNSNANDSLVAMLLVYSFLALKSSRLRGAALALAGAAKFAPLALVPLFAGYSTQPPDADPLPGRRSRS